MSVVIVSVLLATQAVAAWPTPLILQRADPCVYKHTDGYYYFTGSVPEYDRIELRRAKTLAGLATAEPKVVWRKHAKGIMGQHIWAPEMHFIDGKWYVYFAAGEAEHKWNIRMYVLACEAENPLDGKWTELGQIKSFAETFSLDATTFVHKGVRYLSWAQNTPPDRGTDLYIAKMKSPTELDGKPVRISRPDLAWERIGFNVNEGPAVLAKNGRLFMTYSASRTDANYCMGLLTADENADLLDPKTWHKSPKPVLTTDEARKQFGPGHNGFTTAEDGRDVLVFHARPYREIKGDPLYDPNRNTILRYVIWATDGTPVFTGPDE